MRMKIVEIKLSWLSLKSLIGLKREGALGLYVHVIV